MGFDTGALISRLSSFLAMGFDTGALISRLSSFLAMGFALAATRFLTGGATTTCFFTGEDADFNAEGSSMRSNLKVGTTICS
jgi:hypothetical protein